MGEVWSATDTKLDREVALKVLPAAFTEDQERLARFEREAKLLAQFNHPNIAQVYGLETSGMTHALVMELVPGPTLAERLESAPLSLAESLSFALQITQALEEAHDKGIIHRDLKPQNIKASSEGKAKSSTSGSRRRDRTTGELRRLTDHEADDWDPALSPDGRRLLFSSNRTGKFQIWIAEADGSSPRQVTDLENAQNPTMTADGAWIVFGLQEAGADKDGIWKIRPDGTAAALVAAGGSLLTPEVSPDGRYVAMQSTGKQKLLRVADGALLDGDLVTPLASAGRSKPAGPISGRSTPARRATRFAATRSTPTTAGSVRPRSCSPAMQQAAPRPSASPATARRSPSPVLPIGAGS